MHPSNLHVCFISLLNVTALNAICYVTSPYNWDDKTHLFRLPLHAIASFYNVTYLYQCQIWPFLSHPPLLAQEEIIWKKITWLRHTHHLFCPVYWYSDQWRVQFIPIYQDLQKLRIKHWIELNLWELAK